MFVMWLEIGRMLRRSSMATQFLQVASERINLKSSETVGQVDDICSASPKSSARLSPLVEPAHHVLMRLCAIPCVHVLV